MIKKRIGKLSLMCAGIVALTNFSGCSTKTRYNSSEEASKESNLTSPESYDFDDVTTSEQNIESSLTNQTSEPNDSKIETEPFTNPFINMDSNDYNNMVLRFWDSSKIYLGFDNPACLKFLGDEYEKLTGQKNPGITASDVAYFQYDSRISKYMNQTKFSECFTDKDIPEYEIMFIRAILIEENLRFGLDEIPSKYLSNRYPRFLYNELKTDTWKDTEINNIVLSEACLKEYEQVKNPLDFTEPCLNDAMGYMSATNYNLIRSRYIYNNPWGDPNSITDEIPQKRDKNTKKNVLEPTEEQAQQLMDDIHAIPGCENIDIFRVETREEFYACYGIYPEELLDMSRAWQGQFESEEANKFWEEWELTSYETSANVSLNTYDEYAYSGDASSWGNLITDPSQIGTLTDKDFELIPSEGRTR